MKTFLSKKPQLTQKERSVFIAVAAVFCISLLLILQSHSSRIDSLRDAYDYSAYDKEFERIGIQGTATSGPDSIRVYTINSMKAVGLVEISGIGPKIAQRIIDYRERNGPFISVEQMLEVPGIGPKRLNSIKTFIDKQIKK